MFRFTEEVDLESTWLSELEKTPDLSFRLVILVGLRQSLRKKLFSSLIKKDTFLDWLSAVERQMQKWEEGGRPPDEDTLIAFLKLRAGMHYQDVLDQAVEEAMSKPTLRQTSYEANLELSRREQAIRKKIYRVSNSLESAGFSVRHRPKISPACREFIAKIEDVAKSRRYS